MPLTLRGTLATAVARRLVGESSSLGCLRRPLSSAAASLSASEPPLIRAKKAAHVERALQIMNAYAVGRFDETVNISIVLNVDSKRSDERVRGSVVLPHSNGKVARIAVFARGDLAQQAREAGADIVGAEDLVAEIVDGRLDFDRCLATPDMMPALAKAARMLGPKGLMPNPKRGSVTKEVAEAVRLAKAGQVEFRMNKEGVVHAPIGKASFTHNILRDNILDLVCVFARLRTDAFQACLPFLSAVRVVCALLLIGAVSWRIDLNDSAASRPSRSFFTLAQAPECGSIKRCSPEGSRSVASRAARAVSCGRRGGDVSARMTGCPLS